MVVPFFNEEENVTPLLAEIRAVCDALGQSYEAIFVNDGSKDATGRPLDEAAKGWSEAKPFHFLSNHGQAAALRSFPHFCHPSQVLGSRCPKFSQAQCRSLGVAYHRHHLGLAVRRFIIGQPPV